MNIRHVSRFQQHDGCIAGIANAFKIEERSVKVLVEISVAIAILIPRCLDSHGLKEVYMYKCVVCYDNDARAS